MSKNSLSLVIIFGAVILITLTLFYIPDSIYMSVLVVVIGTLAAAYSDEIAGLIRKGDK